MRAAAPAVLPRPSTAFSLVVREDASPLPGRRQAARSGYVGGRSQRVRIRRPELRGASRGGPCSFRSRLRPVSMLCARCEAAHLEL